MDLMDLDGFDGSQLVSQPCMRAPHQQEDGSPPAPQQRWEERWAPTLSLASPPLQALPLLPGPGTASIGWSRVRGRVEDVPGVAEAPLAVTHQRQTKAAQVDQRLWRRRMDGKRVEVWQSGISSFARRRKC